MDELAPVVDLGVVAAGLGPTVDALSFAPVEVTISGPRQMLDGFTQVARTQLLFANADDPSYRVIGGYADALVVDPDEPDLDDRLSIALRELDYPQ